MRLELLAQKDDLIVEPQTFSTDNAVNDSLEDITARTRNQYRGLQEKPSSGKQMRKYAIREPEYFAWKLTGYHGGNRFDEPLCAAASTVLEQSVDEVKNLARKAYRMFSLYYGEEQ